jgi:hypothetical protein
VNGRFVRIVLVRYLRSEGRLSQISIEDRGSALGWELPLDAFHTNGSKGPFTSIDIKGGLQTFAASAKLEV